MTEDPTQHVYSPSTHGYIAIAQLLSTTSDLIQGRRQEFAGGFPTLIEKVWLALCACAQQFEYSARV